MILDNSSEERKIINWFRNETPEDIKFNVVTGYFTIGALYDFLEIVKGKASEINVIFGDMLLAEQIDVPVDLLNGNVTLNDAFLLPKKAREVVEFLKGNKINIKILEPNFCHAKVYLAISEKSITMGYYVTGSSNLTESGLGIKTYNNVELNIAGQPTDPQNSELKTWFDNLWNDTRAKTKVLNNENKSLDVKEYLIQLIECFYKTYTPEEIYYKILYELFKNQLDDKDSPNFQREIGRLESSKIYQSLYPFQQKGAISLIKMLNKFNGAILADAVGLGKTWSALATIKYYQNKGYQIVLIVPKKLHQNWRHYQYPHDSIFNSDKFDFVIRFHTDLQDDRIDNKHDGLTLGQYFQSDKPKLFVIDESHNLRNSKTSRFEFLVNNLLNLEKNPNHKVLLLSATPINTSLNDVKNQFKMLVANKNDGYQEYFNIRNLDSVFGTAQKRFNEWREDENGTIEQLIQLLPEHFTTLADNLIVARTRKIITDLHFPKAEKPINFYVTPEQIGTMESFDELFGKFPPNMAAYSPYLYLKKTDDVSVLEDEWQRDAFLVKMMYILLVKRLESSWLAFYSTLNKILGKTTEVYEAVRQFENSKKSVSLGGAEDLFNEEEDEEYTLGKRAIKLSEIAADGYLARFKEHLKQDIDVMHQVIADLKLFEEQVAIETNANSKDKKLETLIKQIQKKQKERGNKKVLIFTTYRDTAYYLYNELKKRGIQRLGVVSGEDSTFYNTQEKVKHFEHILERFCPYTKLYIERNWPGHEEEIKEKKSVMHYPKWLNWVREKQPAVQQLLHEEIDVLIATDCLSEGQNLQDCDFVVNYDIHWNPVRIIQRVGRVDRIGSPNDSFGVVNFWPTDNINEYLDLEGRIVDRLVAARLTGAEINPELVDRLTRKMKDDNTEEQQKLKLLKQMEQSVEEVEDNRNFAFSNITLEVFRQELNATLKEDAKKWDRIPRGSFSGFVAKNKDMCPKEGMIALLGYPARVKTQTSHAFKTFKLVYVAEDGKLVYDSQVRALVALSTHHKEKRSVPANVDKREPENLLKYSHMLEHYFNQLNNGNTEEGIRQQHANLENLRQGNIRQVREAAADEGLDGLLKKENYELIAWMIVK